MSTLDIYLDLLFVLACALMRFWIGGLPRWGGTWLKYVCWLGTVGSYVWTRTGNPWLAGELALATLAMWRIYGHGPLLRYPLGPNAKDALLLITNTVMSLLGVQHPFPAFALYGLLRYGSFGVILPAIGYFNGLAEYGWLALPGGIPFVYLTTWSMRHDLQVGFFVWLSDISSPYKPRKVDTPSQTEVFYSPEHERLYREQHVDAQQHFHVAALLVGYATGSAIALAVMP